MHLAFTENCCLMVCTLHLKKKKSLAYVIQNVQSYRTTREHSTKILLNSHSAHQYSRTLLLLCLRSFGTKLFQGEAKQSTNNPLFFGMI